MGSARKRIGLFEEEDRKLAELLHKTVLLDWDGIFEGDGTTPVPYESELALKLLSDPEYPKLRDAVVYAAGVITNRRKKSEAQAAKN